MTDQELKDLVASLAISQAKTDEQINNEAKEIKALRQFQQEVTQQMRETDKQMKETDKQIKETSKKVDDTTATIKNIGIQLGNIGKNQGAVAEEFFVNSLSSSLTVGGIEYDELNKNMYKHSRSFKTYNNRSEERSGGNDKLIFVPNVQRLRNNFKNW